MIQQQQQPSNNRSNIRGSSSNNNESSITLSMLPFLHFLQPDRLLQGIEMMVDWQECQALAVVEERSEAALEAFRFDLGKKSGWCS